MLNDSLSLFSDTTNSHSTFSQQFAFEDTIQELRKQDYAGTNVIFTPLYETKNSNQWLEEVISKSVCPFNRKKPTINFGVNQVKVFEADAILDPKPLLPTHTKGSPKKPILAKNDNLQPVATNSYNTDMDWEENIPIHNSVLLDTVTRCFNLCGLPQEDLDTTDLVMTLQRLSFGITSAFKTQELCYKYLGQRQKEKLLDNLALTQKDLDLKTVEIEKIKLESETLSQQINSQGTHESEVVDLQNEVGFLQDELKEKVDLIEKEQSESSKILAEFEDQKLKLKQATHDLQELQLDYDELHIRHTSLQGNYEEVTKERDSLFQSSQEKDAELKILRKEIAREQASALKLLAENEKSNHDLLAKERASCNSLRNKVAEYSQDCERLEKTSNNFALELNKAKNAAEDFKKGNDALISKITNAEEKLQTVTNLKLEADKKILLLKRTNKDLKQLNYELARIDVLMRSKLNEAIDNYQEKEKKNMILQTAIELSTARLRKTRLDLSSANSPKMNQEKFRKAPSTTIPNRANNT